MDPADIKITSKLSSLKPLHASWIVDLYKRLSDNQEIIVNGFDSAGISEAVTKASTILDKVENPLQRGVEVTVEYILVVCLYSPSVSCFNYFTYPFQEKVN